MITKITKTANGFCVHISPRNKATQLADCLVDSGVEVLEVRMNFLTDQATVFIPFSGTLSEEKLQRFIYEKFDR